MKGEERIIELLSEYLRKSDKHEEEIMQNQQNIEKMLVKLDRNQVSIENNQQEIKALRSESLKNQIQQDVVLKEILSISKRVSSLEAG